MLPKYLQNKLIYNVVRSIMPFMVSLFAVPVYAASDTYHVTSLSAADMIANIANQMPTLMQMVTAIAYVMGMYFIFYGIVKLKHFGESRTTMSADHSLWEPIVLLVIGTFLLYLPTSVQVGMSSFWANPNPYGYLEQEDQWSQFINDCFMIVQFVGVIAFIRGLVILSQLSGHAQHGTFGRGLAHIIGGILCINIYQFVQVILVTLGIQID